ncbi:hypothetical protein [Tropicimonas sp. IMCC6043]|uniref:hypothetical protein n=1 Tax=Tropicimonas sp. IMCC6043 TaxID=2510645 RepID=UPI00101D1184|nr:hypothetical protein [Tropicimonas sp. IMCC6043]RYH07781.1 hypothetical protein EU800_18840 [Tropicimonas sp. IMCC6043]
MTDARTITRALNGRWHGNTGSARCPAHDDRHPSLSIGDADNGGLLLTCHAGCTFEGVIDALKVKGILDGTAPTDRWSPIPQILDHHREAITAALGNLVTQIDVGLKLDGDAAVEEIHGFLNGDARASGAFVASALRRAGDVDAIREVAGYWLQVLSPTMGREVLS